MALNFFKSDIAEHDLIKAIREGGKSREQATDFLLHRHIYYVQKLSKRFGISEETVLDAYTDALMALLDNVILGHFKGESKLSTYLYRILFNKCCDLLKKKSTNTVELNEWIVNLDNLSQSFLKEIFEKEEVESLYLYLDKIGETCKQILIDWGYWGYKMEEIAERVGLDDGDQAKKQKYRCLQKLKKIMGD